MILAYTTDIRDGIATFQEEEARHTLQVLRKRAGDPVQWVDGKGGWYEGEILATTKRAFTATVRTHAPEYNARPYRLTLAVAPTKNINRYEWLLEKATEVGIDRIVPIWCAHSERSRVRPDRLQKILVSAMKQSLKAYLPELVEPLPLLEFLAADQLSASTAHRLIAHCGPGEKAPMPSNFAAGADVCILIGPEGDFSPEEVAAATRAGYRPLSLGRERLRTETAALAACVLANYELAKTR